MALKYWFEFTDVKEIIHRCEIYNDDYVGSSTQIYGSLSLSKASTKDTLESIRGGGLKIDLEANLGLTFSDFYSENERVFSVKYIRNSVELFYGWLSPEGLYESFVDEKWIISLDCTDGLGFLKNLSYVENNGVPFSGKQSGLEIITNCLKRTNLEQNLHTSIGVFYSGLATSLNVLANTYLNSNRFVKDDKGDTYMNCDEVLRSVLEPYGACITQYKGAWYVYKPNELYDDRELDFFSYDFNGTALVPSTVSIDFTENIGSQINSFYPHHVNKNQQLTVDSSIGAYRINYKYGLVKSFFENIDLISVTSPPPTLFIDEWTINDITYLTFPSDNLGFILDIAPFATPIATPTLILTSDSFNFDAGNILQFNTTFNLLSGVSAKSIVDMYFKIILTDGTTTYYMDKDGEWSTTDGLISSQVKTQIKTVILQSASIPIAGGVTIEIYRPVKLNNQGTVTDAFISKCGFSPINEDLEDIDGENHTFQIIDKPSTKIEKVKEVYNGDNPSDVYVGTIYKSDESTPTDVWFRIGNLTREIPLLQIMGEERMKMYAKPLRVFSGDVFGFVEYLSVVFINGISEVFFAPIEYNYDAKANITKIKLKETLNLDIVDTDNSGIDYELTYDYGNVVEPTIKG